MPSYDEDYMSKTFKKMVIQTCALTKIATSTWGVSFVLARQIYFTVIQPAIIYGSAIWHALSRTKDAKKNITEKLAIIQNRCLKVVAGAYKATLIEVLHAKTMIPPMQEHLNLLQAKTHMRLRSVEQSVFIKKQCKKITAKLHKQGTISIVDTLKRQKNQWSYTITEKVADIPPLQDLFLWIEKSEEYIKLSISYWNMQRQRKELIENHFTEK